jgi:hypothetical protein
MPRKIAALPRDSAGRPVPWFVAWIDGTPDFRVIGPGKIQEALRRNLCWVCGKVRISNSSFVIGPMCAVNRTSAEPPSHHACALYSAKACPFLANPGKARRDTALPEDMAQPPGESIRRNPGVALVWTSENWSTFNDGRGGTLFDVGQPSQVEWIAEGRAATRDEVVESIRTGLPTLAKMAHEEGLEAMAELDRYLERAMALVPA